MSDFSDWIGREERRSDTLGIALCERWLATFDRAAPVSGAMPQGIHFCLCTPDAPSSALGADGHPARPADGADFLPPIDLPRRMWAGSEIAFLAPLAPGAAIERISRIADIAEKDGRSGRLAFIKVEHETRADGLAAIREVQSLVYRAAASPDDPLAPPEPGDAQFDETAWDATRSITPDPRLLFRYSALTFNTHRIHYDAPYARDAERYRGLVVHGPLMASLLLDLAAQQLGDNALARFAFRAFSPAIAGERLYLALRDEGDQLAIGAFAADGREVLRGAGTRAQA